MDVVERRYGGPGDGREWRGERPRQLVGVRDTFLVQVWAVQCSHGAGVGDAPAGARQPGAA